MSESSANYRIRYASPDGNDANDGLSWVTAKRTILAAYDSLGDSLFVGGTIYIASGSEIADQNDTSKNVPGQGIWLLGKGDPGFVDDPAMLPKGWRFAHPVKFVGVPTKWGSDAGAAASIGVQVPPALVGKSAYDAADRTSLKQFYGAPSLPVEGWISLYHPARPAIWLAGGVGGVSFENLIIEYPSVGIRVGICTDGTTGPAEQFSILFRNIHVRLNDTGWINPFSTWLADVDDHAYTKGPAVQVAFALGVTFEHCSFDASPILYKMGVPYRDLANLWQLAKGTSPVLAAPTDPFLTETQSGPDLETLLLPGPASVEFLPDAMAEDPLPPGENCDIWILADVTEPLAGTVGYLQASAVVGDYIVFGETRVINASTNDWTYLGRLYRPGGSKLAVTAWKDGTGAVRLYQLLVCSDATCSILVRPNGAHAYDAGVDSPSPASRPDRSLPIRKYRPFRVTGDGPGMLKISDCFFLASGGVKDYGTEKGWGLTILDCVFEGTDGAPRTPPIHFLDTNNVGTVLVVNCAAADPESRNGLPDVRFEGTSIADNAVCINVPYVEGPATVYNQNANAWIYRRTTPFAQGQIGFWKYRVAGQHDSARRSFGPMAVRYPNLAPHDPAIWRQIGGPDVSITTPAMGPDGTANAGRCTTDTVSFCKIPMLALALNDQFIFGAWIRATNPMDGITPRLNLDSGDSGTKFADGRDAGVNRSLSSSQSAGVPLLGDGEWQWLWNTAIVAQVNPSAAATANANFFLSYASESHPVHVYAPILIHIPAADSLSANELQDLALHLTSWPDGVPPGTVTTLPGQSLTIHKPLLLAGSRIPNANCSAASGVVCTLVGNDEAGTITLGCTGAHAGQLLDVLLNTFAPPNSTPTVILTPTNHLASLNKAGFYAQAKNRGKRSYFTIDAFSAPPNGLYSWNYLVTRIL